MTDPSRMKICNRCQQGVRVECQNEPELDCPNLRRKATPASTAADRALTGNQSKPMLRNMVRALSMHPWLNTPEEKARLAAAKRLLG